ncbi:MAG TPA: hypothetical protein VFV14_05510 [Myxococcaceae bacterium]|nr:hypothetical protein [Myxococcaceae bacterium]
MADDRDARAREELERAVREMVKLPPATVEVVFDGIDSTRYKLLEGSFTLDDRPLPSPGGSSVLFSGEIQPGRHILSTSLVYEAPSPTHGFIKYKVPGKFIFTAQRGVLMRVRARIEVDDAAEPSKRLQLMGQAETDLRADLEESLPPSPEHKPPKLAEKEEAEEPRRREAEAVRVAAASAVSPAIQPAALKPRVAHRKPSNPVPDEAPAAPAAEKPAEATPPPEEHQAPSPAPIAVEQPAPASPPSPAPVSTKPEALTGLLGALQGFGTAIAGFSMALLGLLLLAMARKKR